MLLLRYQGFFIGVFVTFFPSSLSRIYLNSLSSLGRIFLA
ncbi:Uncharacterised protein [Yersinia rohdei]|nr:Uncharacterised protein [Yersinia rohdei]